MVPTRTGCPFLMSGLDLFNHCTEFLFFRHVNRIVQVFTDHRTVGRDLHNVHAVDLTELFFLGQSRTGHTGFLVIFIEEVLEGDGCQRLALTSYFYMLFCLNRLMESIGVTAARHDTAGKLINDENLVVFYHIVADRGTSGCVALKCQNDVVLDLQVLRICQVLDMEEILHLLNAQLRQVYNLVFLIDDEIAGLARSPHP